MSIYRQYTKDQLDELFSNYLINSWSVSKVNSFVRNEKAFEMSYIYNVRSKQSATAVGGSAYHEALRAFFTELRDNGKELGLVELEAIAFDFINKQPANTWKIQKTMPSVEECIKKASETAKKGLFNFYKEKSIYLDDIEDIILIEDVLYEFITINGVDIPLPCKSVLDLAYSDKNGNVKLVDHKLKAAISDDKEVILTHGKQAITYVKMFEAKYGQPVTEFLFIENKHSQNRDGSAQLTKFPFEINDNNRRLYEALLYEPLRKMIEAVNNPDYVYLINESDNFTDMAELYDFWAKTMISEVDDFNIDESKRTLIGKRKKRIRDIESLNLTPNIIKQFRNKATEFIQYDFSTMNTNEEKIEHVLRTFGIIAKVAKTFDGFSSNTYLLELSAGTKINNIYSHKLDLANALDVPSIRIMKELKIYEGKSYVAIESGKKRDKTLLYDEKYLSGYKIPVGLNNYGETIFWDLDSHSTPHALVCGATGSGKSVFINSTINYSKKAGVNEIYICDPKFEFLKLSGNGIQVYNDIEQIEFLIKKLVDDMDKRIESGETRKTLVIFDEFADAVQMARSGNELNIYDNVTTGMYSNGIPKVERKIVGKEKSLEENLKRLLQKGRSSGFRVLAATQRASTKVITGDSKVNFPVQICFRVPKEVDSKVVIDEGGAELLSGSGDGLMRSPDYLELVRFQAFFKP